jgi:hypothetical protein
MLQAVKMLKIDKPASAHQPGLVKQAFSSLPLAKRIRSMNPGNTRNQTTDRTDITDEKFLRFLR